MKKIFLAGVLFLMMSGSALALQQGVIYVETQRIWADTQYIHMGITACVVDSTGDPPPFCPVGLGDIQLDINALAEDVTWKDTIVNTLITEANENGYSLTAGDVVIFSMEPGDYKRETRAATWTKDATKTNVGTSFVNVYAGFAGESQGVNFLGYKQYRLIVTVNKVGTGTQTAALVDVLNADNYISVDDAAAAGEHRLDTDWQSLPAWANGIFGLKAQAKSTTGTDDPVYRQFVLYLR